MKLKSAKKSMSRLYMHVKKKSGQIKHFHLKKKKRRKQSTHIVHTNVHFTKQKERKDKAVGTKYIPEHI